MSRRVRDIDANQDLISEGDSPEDVHLILEGFAVRYKLTTQGRRQILAYMIAGDFCDVHVTLLRRMDHGIRTLRPSRVVRISPGTLLEILERQPAIARAIWLCGLVDEATQREWLVNVGQRSAPQRIAHLFCEMHVRMGIVGLTSNGSFELPLTQEELGDTMGLSNVHVNRSLKELRESELVTLRNGQIVISDVDRLKAFSGFDPSYLHLERTAPFAPADTDIA
ncbi:Crp/Fnr family transcriptional regulator [Aureimonas pseudogalii]|uniref:CRP-like cAMP-binding protein n=1 Tax=Aureimonas pseudogalii TaxID=1744844 RepID=A0A7W6H4P9_9HYPH|nr:Crp/Fnr family transcriptional regulator [Aureimonas pseudogalii]MBB3997639.1 CRP-like cAMP-binding protein [Aureimonas pseudogalii]